MLIEESEQELQLREPVGAWLLAQVDRGDCINGLAAAARTNRGFPERGDVEQVRMRQQAHGADLDTFKAPDDAELDWRSY